MIVYESHFDQFQFQFVFATLIACLSLATAGDPLADNSTTIARDGKGKKYNGNFENKCTLRFLIIN